MGRPLTCGNGCQSLHSYVIVRVTTLVNVFMTNHSRRHQLEPLALSTREVRTRPILQPLLRVFFGGGCARLPQLR